jgi:hypothetical protein
MRTLNAYLSTVQNRESKLPPSGGHSPLVLACLRKGLVSSSERYVSTLPQPYLLRRTLLLHDESTSVTKTTNLALMTRHSFTDLSVGFTLYKALGCNV